MQQDDPFIDAYSEAQELLQAARPDQVAEALRLLACEVAYYERYHERPTLDELTARIREADKDAAGMEVVVDGMRHLVAVLRRL